MPTDVPEGVRAFTPLDGSYKSLAYYLGVSILKTSRPTPFFLSWTRWHTRHGISLRTFHPEPRGHLTSSRGRTHKVCSFQEWVYREETQITGPERSIRLEGLLVPYVYPLSFWLLSVSSSRGSNVTDEVRNITWKSLTFKWTWSPFTNIEPSDQTLVVLLTPLLSLLLLTEDHWLVGGGP